MLEHCLGLLVSRSKECCSSTWNTKIFKENLNVNISMHA
jgi:hypothetical protein